MKNQAFKEVFPTRHQPFDGLNFGSYQQPGRLRDKERLLIHNRINTNAHRVEFNERLVDKLKSEHPSTRLMMKDHIGVQIWFFINNLSFFCR